MGTGKHKKLRVLSSPTVSKMFNSKSTLVSINCSSTPTIFEFIIVTVANLTGVLRCQFLPQSTFLNILKCYGCPCSTVPLIINNTGYFSNKLSYLRTLPYHCFLNCSLTWGILIMRINVRNSISRGSVHIDIVEILSK